MYNKLKIAAILSLSLSMALPVLASEKLKLNMDGVVLNTVSPILEDGVVMVDSKEIFNLLGGKVTYTSNNDSVKIIKDDKSLEFILGKDTVWINDSKTGTKLEKAPYKLDNIIYIPLKTVAEAFDGTMKLSKDSGTVSLTTEEGNLLIVKPSNGTKITFKEALDTATKNNSTLDDYKYTVDQIDKNIRNIDISVARGSNLVEFPGLSSIRDTLFNASMSQEEMKYATEIMKASIESNVRNCFSSIKLAEMSIALKEEEIKLAKKNLDAMSKKLELGLESQYNYDNKLKDYENLTVTLGELNRALETYNITLGRLMSKTTNLKSYKVEYDVKYELFKPIANISTHATVKVNMDPSVKKAELALEKAEYTLLNAGKDDQKYDDYERDVTKAKDSINEAKNNIDVNIKTTYTKIQNQENTYNKALSDLETARKNYNLAKVKYNTGLISRLDLENSKYAVMAAEVGLQNAIYTYDNLKFSMEYPFL